MNQQTQTRQYVPEKQIVTALNFSEDFVPLFTSKLLAPDYKLPYSCLHSTGESYEISLKILRSFDPSYTLKLEKYWELCRKSFTDRQSKMPTVTVSRFLREDRQTDTAGKRYDLVEQYKFLANAPFSKDLVEILLSANPELSQISNHSSCESVITERSGYVVSLTGRGQQVWPTSLGGLPSPREVARSFKLTTNYAAWRDRKVRRLTKVESRAIEVWPSPANIDL